MVVSHPSTGDISPAAVSYTSGFYHIPVVGITSRDSAFSDKVRHAPHALGSPRTPETAPGGDRPQLRRFRGVRF